MRCKIDDLDPYLDSLSTTLDAFDSIWPEFDSHGISKDAAFTGWMMMCMIDYISAQIDEGEDDWQLAG